MKARLVECIFFKLNLPRGLGRLKWNERREAGSTHPIAIIIALSSVFLLLQLPLRQIRVIIGVSESHCPPLWSCFVHFYSSFLFLMEME